MVSVGVTMEITYDIQMLASDAAPAAKVAACPHWLEGTRRFGNHTALARRCYR
jgi:hypothetical protein